MENNIIKLRAPEPEDLDLLYETENNPDFWEYGDTITPISKHDLKIYIENASKDIFTVKQLKFVIEIRPEKIPVGFIDLFDFEPVHLRAAAGIIIFEPYRRKNYALNALETLQIYVFSTLKLNQLYCHISEDNRNSIKLFEKAGFIKTGNKLNWINSENGFKNVCFYQCFNPANK
jgi:diamine N-acetyltransferase